MQYFNDKKVSVALEDLTNEQLVHLLEFCKVSPAVIKAIKEQAVNGSEISKGMLMEKDFTDFGINPLPARILCKQIAKWKADFYTEVNKSDEQYILGHRFENGTGVTRNAPEAVRYYKLAADQGHANAQTQLGFCYQNGIGVSKDEKEGMRYYQRAADQGLALAQRNLGVCFANGAGCTKNDAEAVRYYKLAADQGVAFAQYDLGCCYADGAGVTKDEQEAMRYCKLAAEQGHAKALYRLGLFYENDTAVSKDEQEAVRYYKLAADQGNQSALQRLTRLTPTCVVSKKRKVDHDGADVAATDGAAAAADGDSGGSSNGGANSSSSSSNRPKLAGFELFAQDKRAEAEQMFRNGDAADSESPDAATVQDLLMTM